MEMEDSMTLDILLENLLATGCPVQQNEPMRLHTTFKIGGPPICRFTQGPSPAW